MAGQPKPSLRPKPLNCTSVSSISVCNSLASPSERIEVRWERWHYDEPPNATDEDEGRNPPGQLIVQGNDTGFIMIGEGSDDSALFSVHDVRDLRMLAELLVRLSEKVQAAEFDPSRDLAV